MRKREKQGSFSILQTQINHFKLYQSAWKSNSGRRVQKFNLFLLILDGFAPLNQPNADWLIGFAEVKLDVETSATRIEGFTHDSDSLLTIFEVTSYVFI